MQSTTQPHPPSLDLNLERMLALVNDTIKQFLSNLEFIYRSNGICFRVQGFRDGLVRMLTPFQMIGGLRGFRGREKGLEEQQNYERHQPTPIPKTLSILQPYLSPQPPESSSSPQPSSYQPSSNSQDPSKPSIKLPIQQSKSPFFTKKMQARLCKWISQQMERGIRVSRKEILDQARLISRNQKFLGSPGWLQRFFNRNSEVKRLMGIKDRVIRVPMRKTVFREIGQGKYQTVFLQESNQQENKNESKIQQSSSSQQKKIQIWEDDDEDDEKRSSEAKQSKI